MPVSGQNGVQFTLDHLFGQLAKAEEGNGDEETEPQNWPLWEQP